MSSEPSTPLLTVEDLLAMVTERNDLWARARQLSAQIDHVRQFIGDDKFLALVGPQEAVPSGGPVRRPKELSMGDVILKAIDDEPDGVSYDDLRQRIATSGLPKRSPNSFFNTIARLHTAKEAVRAGGRLFSREAYAGLDQERVDELKQIDAGGRGTTGVAKATVDTIRAGGRGMTASEVIAEMSRTHPDIKSSAIYASLSRLKIAEALVRDGAGRYVLPLSEERTV